MKKYTLILFLISILLISTSCNKNQEAFSDEKIKPVKTLIVKEEESPIILKYVGMVGIDEMKKMAFKSTGKIEDVYVDKCQRIRKGEVIAKLNTEDIEFMVEASKAQYEKKVYMDYEDIKLSITTEMQYF